MTACSKDTNKETYNQAVEQLNGGNYQNALELFETIPDYEGVSEKIVEAKKELFSIIFQIADSTMLLISLLAAM